MASILRIKNELCELENEICSCFDKQPSLGNIQMNCFERSGNTSFSFETLKILIKNNTNVTLNIQNKQITQFSSTTNVSNNFRLVTSLIMENCKIAKIWTNFFMTLNFLQELYLNTNEIEILERDAFVGLELSLKKLELYSNRIKSMGNRVFKGLILLEQLDLRGNEMSQLEMGSFRTLINLKILYLSSNKFKLIRFDFFRNLTSLELLGLSGNEIETIESDSFNECLNMKTLYLSSNKISEIKRGFFTNLKRLETLWLHRNEIINIELNSFIDTLKLKLIYLSSNKIKSIQMGQFNYLTSLEIFHIYQNEIATIETSESLPTNLIELNLNTNKISKIRVLNLTKLTLLNLSSNSLVSLTLKNMPKLKWLDLSHNYLDGYMSKAFENLNPQVNLNLEFNLIQRLTKSLLSNFNVLSLRNNGLKFIDAFSFEASFSLETLYLDTNRLSQLDKWSLANMTQLKHLFLGFNRIKEMKLIRESLGNLINLETIDLSSNLIEYINESDFNFSSRLSSINLNSNFIRKIHQNSFRNFLYLKAFSFAQKNNDFDLNIFHSNASIQHLDLSFNRILYSSDLTFLKCFQNIESLKLNKVLFASNTTSLNFDLFLNVKIKYLDISENDLSNEFSLLENMSQIEWLELRQTNLSSMNSISFPQFKFLTHLDVSFNQLQSLEWHSFQSLTSLEYLNVNNNRISYVDCRIFNGFIGNKMNSLKYLSMENNQIISLTDIRFTNYLSLKLFSIANNVLSEMPNFAFDWSGTFASQTNQFMFNRNSLKRIRPFSKSTYSIEILNFDFNLIDRIDFNTFYYLKSLVNLSLAYNQLELIEKNNFYYLNSLKYLNLSHNRIGFIEIESFCNLNKLLTLDLSFNCLISIESSQVFVGLNYLNELNLIGNERRRRNLLLNNNSFFYLINIGTFYLNETTIVTNKCLFMHSLKRMVKRNIENKFKFYKAINLISPKQTESSDMCELVFEFFQFNIFFNLKYDAENEAFYEKCQHVLIGKENNFNVNFKKCVDVYLVDDDLKEPAESFEKGESKLVCVLTDFRFYFILCLLLSVFGPYFLMIFKHLRRSDKKRHYYARE